MLTIQELVQDNEEKIPLVWIAGKHAAARALATSGAYGAEMVGHLNLIHPKRIQVFGTEELAYYRRFDTRRRQHHLRDLITDGVPAIILADGTDAP